MLIVVRAIFLSLFVAVYSVYLLRMCSALVGLLAFSAEGVRASWTGGGCSAVRAETVLFLTLKLTRTTYCRHTVLKSSSCSFEPADDDAKYLSGKCVFIPERFTDPSSYKKKRSVLSIYPAPFLSCQYQSNTTRFYNRKIVLLIHE